MDTDMNKEDENFRKNVNKMKALNLIVENYIIPDDFDAHEPRVHTCRKERILRAYRNGRFVLQFKRYINTICCECGEVGHPTLYCTRMLT